MERTGFNVEELDNRVKELENARNQLQPTEKKLRDLQKQIKDLESTKKDLTKDVNSLNERHGMISQHVQEKEQHLTNLSAQILSLEERLQVDDERLSKSRKDLTKLATIGLSSDELSGFVERIDGVAHRHGVLPKALHGKLLTELESLDKGLALDSVVQGKQHEIKILSTEILKTKQDLTTLTNQKQKTMNELSSVQAQADAEKKEIEEELRAIKNTARNAVSELQRS